MIDIVDEQPGDAGAIEKLLNSAFGPRRKRKISYRFRHRLKPVAGLSLVAKDDGVLAGTIRHWPIVIADNDGSERAALLLGPLAVATSHRGRGIGAGLMNEGLARARASGYRMVVLVGDLAYYQRFGFRLASSSGIIMPSERAERVLVVKLCDSSPTASGTIRHATMASTKNAQEQSAA